MHKVPSTKHVTKSGKPYQKTTSELRELIMEKYESMSCSKAEISRTFGLPYLTVNNVINTYKIRGRIQKKKTGSYVSKFIKIKGDHSQFILEFLDEDCTSLTLGRTKKKFEEQFNLSASVPTIWRHIVQNIIFTFKRTKPVEMKWSSK